MSLREEFRILAAQMDVRQKAIDLAKEKVAEGKTLPDSLKYLEKFFDEKPWREDKKIVAKIWKAAKKSARNKRKKNGKR